MFDAVWRARPHAENFQEKLLGNPDVLPALDPLFSALPVAVHAWAGRTGRPIRVVHDTQAALTEVRVELIINGLARPHPDLVRYVPAVCLVAIDQVDSSNDPRVQVADLLAGASRMIATGALDGRKDHILCEALGPLVEQHSVWSDERSWQALVGRNTRRTP